MKEYVIYKKLMGSAFSLGIVANDENEANHFLNLGIVEIMRLENLLSEYKHSSVTTTINVHDANIPLEIPKEVAELISRCNNISKLTLGAFDITVNALKKIYSFKKESFQLPEQQTILKSLESVGYSNLKIDTSRLIVTKLKHQMSISFNAIGKGYASECVKNIWLKNGISSGFINASGDLCAFGNKANGENWQIGIADPNAKEKMILYITIENHAVATSGDYENYFMHQGKRFSHTINPITGLPLSGIKSVSVISPNAELSDALATAVYVMGEKTGIDFVNQLPKTHCILVNEHNQLKFSKHLNYEEISL